MEFILRQHWCGRCLLGNADKRPVRLQLVVIGRRQASPPMDWTAGSTADGFLGNNLSIVIAVLLSVNGASVDVGFAE